MRGVGIVVGAGAARGKTIASARKEQRPGGGKRKTRVHVWSQDGITSVAAGMRNRLCLVHERSRLALAFATPSLSSWKA